MWLSKLRQWLRIKGTDDTPIAPIENVRDRVKVEKAIANHFKMTVEENN